MPWGRWWGIHAAPGRRRLPGNGWLRSGGLLCQGRQPPAVFPHFPEPLDSPARPYWTTLPARLGRPAPRRFAGFSVQPVWDGMAHLRPGLPANQRLAARRWRASRSNPVNPVFLALAAGPGDERHIDHDARFFQGDFAFPSASSTSANDFSSRAVVLRST